MKTSIKPTSYARWLYSFPASEKAILGHWPKFGPSLAQTPNSAPLACGTRRPENDLREIAPEGQQNPFLGPRAILTFGLFGANQAWTDSNSPALAHLWPTSGPKLRPFTSALRSAVSRFLTFGILASNQASRTCIPFVFCIGSVDLRAKCCIWHESLWPCPDFLERDGPMIGTPHLLKSALP